MIYRSTAFPWRLITDERRHHEAVGPYSHRVTGIVPMAIFVVVFRRPMERRSYRQRLECSKRFNTAETFRDESLSRSGRRHSASTGKSSPASTNRVPGRRSNGRDHRRCRQARMRASHTRNSPSKSRDEGAKPTPALMTHCVVKVPIVGVSRRRRQGTGGHFPTAKNMEAHERGHSATHAASLPVIPQMKRRRASAASAQYVLTAASAQSVTTEAQRLLALRVTTGRYRKSRNSSRRSASGAAIPSSRNMTPIPCAASMIPYRAQWRGRLFSITPAGGGGAGRPPAAVVRQLFHETVFNHRCGDFDVYG